MDSTTPFLLPQKARAAVGVQRLSGPLAPRSRQHRAFSYPTYVAPSSRVTAATHGHCAGPSPPRSASLTHAVSQLAMRTLDCAQAVRRPAIQRPATVSLAASRSLRVASLGNCWSRCASTTYCLLQKPHPPPGSCHTPWSPLGKQKALGWSG